MSQQISPTSDPSLRPTQKQKLGIYTMMLIVSFIALVIACVLMSMELSKWGPYPHWKAGAPNSTSSLQWSEDAPSLAAAQGLNAPVNFHC